MNTKFRKFRHAIWIYYRTHRRNLPWRRTQSPYKILISEVMLQQTQVERVIPKYREFLRRFPNFQTLARASLKDILNVWQGLGYNRRALYLKRLSEIITKEYSGKLPANPELLLELPGIGKATAGAIAAFAFGKPIPFIETNIRRVFIHFFFPKQRQVSDDEILKIVARTQDRKNPREWFYALMDYGAMLGKKFENPNRKSASYIKQSPFKGSRRELRGKLLKAFLTRNAIKRKAVTAKVFKEDPRSKEVLQALTREGFL